MLDIQISRIESSEHSVIITAEVSIPRHFGDALDGGEDKATLELHKLKCLEYLQLHLGSAILSQSRVE